MVGEGEGAGMQAQKVTHRRLPRSWSAHSLNQRGCLSRRRSGGRLGPSEEPTLRNQHVNTAKGGSRQKILESKHKGSKWPVTWGCFCANIQTPQPVSGAQPRKLVHNEAPGHHEILTSGSTHIPKQGNQV